MCFLAEFQGVFGGLLWDAGMALYQALQWNTMSTSLTFLRHLVVLLFVIRCLHATLDEALGSVTAFRSAAGKTKKSLHKKMSRINSHLTIPCQLITSATVPAAPTNGREDRAKQQQKEDCPQTVEEEHSMRGTGHGIRDCRKRRMTWHDQLRNRRIRNLD
jgi:hypothetical protein